MHTGKRGIAYAMSTTTLVAALVAGSATAALAADDDFTVTASGLLTLPAGDDFNDSVEVSISSATAATVNVSVVEAPSGTVIPVATDVELTATADGFGKSVELSVDGIAAGTHELLVERSDDATSSGSTELVVGSGIAVNNLFLISRTSVFPYVDGYRDTSEGSVVALDETGMELPITGSVKLTVGSKSATAAFDGDNHVTVPVGKVGLGSGKVAATFVDPAGTVYTPAAESITLRATELTKAKLSVPTSVYPKKDTYRDTAKITLSATSSTGESLRTKGTVTVSLKGKTVKTWTVGTSAKKTLTWNGLNKNKVKTGKYTVTYSTVGPQGKRVKTTASVTVSDKKLVLRTTSEWKKANKVLRKYVPLDSYQQGYCMTSKGRVGCVGYDLYADANYSLVVTGDTSVPSAVRNSAKYRTPKVRVSIDVDSLSGKGAWAYGSSKASKQASLRKGAKNIGWLGLTDNPKKVAVTVGLAENSTFVASRVRVEYRYYLLK